VQGVGFRYFAIRAARDLGLTGEVRNLRDGSVEAIAEGEAGAIDQFRKRLERGPDSSNVTAVDEIPIEMSGKYRGFDVAY
jgi:acylphosphatase